MNVLVDTSVWSIALRRAKRVNDAAPRELAELISEGRVEYSGNAIASINLRTALRKERWNRLFGPWDKCCVMWPSPHEDIGGVFSGIRCLAKWF